MRQKIFQSILLGCMGMLIGASLVFLFVLNQYFNASLKQELSVIADLIDDQDDVETIDWAKRSMEVVLKKKAGTIVYASQTSSNHYEDQSITLHKTLANGDILTLTQNKLSIPMQTLALLRPLSIVLGIGLIFSLFLSYKIAKECIKPLYDIDLDHPKKEKAYPELDPIIDRLSRQRKEIRKQNRQLEHKHEELRTLMNGITQGIVLINEKNIVVQINEAAMQMGNLHGPVQGFHFLKLFPEEALKKAILEEKIKKKVLTIKREDHTYEFHLDPIETHDKFSGQAILILDISEKEKMEQIRREFSANISHELKTPIQSILGYSELLDSKCVKKEDQPLFVKKIYNKALFMRSIVEELLDLSKMEQEVDRLNFESIDMKELIEQIIEMHKLSIEKKELTIKTKLEPVKLFGHHKACRMILNNLIDNAIKYNRNKGTITICLEQKNQEGATIMIQDTGIGIASEEQEHIFDRFYRSNLIRSSYPGSGIGLSIVKHALLLMHGSIQVESKLGKGTRFLVTF